MALLCRDPFTQSSFHAEAVSHTQAFKHRAALTNRPFAQTAFYTEHTLHTRAFTKRLLSTETLFTQRPSWQRDPFCITQRTFCTRRGFCTETLLHAEAFIRSSFYRSRFNTHAQVLTWDPFKKRHTETPLHRDMRRPFCIRRPFHTIPHTQIRLLTEQLLHRDPFYRDTLLTPDSFLHEKLFAQRPRCIQKLLHRHPFTHEGFYTETLSNRSSCTETLLDF